MILMYHKVHPNTPTMWWVSVNDFFRQMSELQNKKVVYLDDYEIGNEDQVVITFDGIYKNVLEFALPILRHFDYPFELFLTSDYLGLSNEFDSVEPNAPFTDIEELKKLMEGGGRLQWHTCSHPNLKKVEDIEVLNKELSVPSFLKSIDVNGFKWFAYPHGEYNPIVLEEVKKRFKGALTCFQGNDQDVYELNRLTVVSETSFRKNSISCIISSYNYGDYLVEAIESVLKQTIQPNEILISDDCSSDDTALIAEAYVKKYPELIRFNRNEKNLGVVDHFNKAIELTSGEYVFFLGADNRLLSNYVEESAKILDSDNKIGVAYTDYAFFGSRAKLKFDVLRDSIKGEIKENYYQVNFPEFEDQEELRLSLKKDNFIHGSSMYRRDAFKEVNGYQKHSSTPEDYSLFQRITNLGWKAKKVVNTNLEYRQHSLSQVDNVLGLQVKMLFYKKQYEQLLQSKNAFEKSKVYKFANKVYRAKHFLRRNLKNPKKILKRFLKF